ncbi:hypothetical protein BJ742DRAFT_868952 [Cladochytrium replicatum]|nr:hypothetical protein BJ742DRAFT_868952 [Cladochytrium replicatum]
MTVPLRVALTTLASHLIEVHCVSKLVEAAKYPSRGKSLGTPACSPTDVGSGCVRAAAASGNRRTHASSETWLCTNAVDCHSLTRWLNTLAHRQKIKSTEILSPQLCLWQEVSTFTLELNLQRWLERVVCSTL